MQRVLRFRLNSTLVEITEREEILVLDWLRREKGLTGTKEGCREGDCGACMVLLGERAGDTRNGNSGDVKWRAALSCLLALGELDGRHIVTIEGIGSGGLTPVMTSMLDEGASQCGFCSPGFVVSLTAYLVGGGALSHDGAVRAVEGNLCRCTGYGSIARAADRLIERFGTLPELLTERLSVLSQAGVIPPEIARYMTDIPKPAGSAEYNRPKPGSSPLTLGGGTDYFVRNPDPEPADTVAFSDRDPALRQISRVDEAIILGASVSVQEFFESDTVRSAFPGIESCEPDFASLPIRTRATLAGNITNASPIGDMTAILIALRAQVGIRSAAGGGGRSAPAERNIPIEDYFVSYRRTALAEGEQVAHITLPLPSAGPQRRLFFNFEKVAKRRHLDIASANSACLAIIEADGSIGDITLSAGGVGPVPMRLPKTESFLRGKRIDRQIAQQAADIAAAECTPIDDVRGAAAYRRTLLGRFVWAHLMRALPELSLEKELLS
ncbi:FAD binding domain-containing protein [Salinispira pacifica]